MGCEFSRFLVWHGKPGRKRLSSAGSGGSDLKVHDVDSLYSVDKAAEMAADREGGETMSHLSRLRKIFSRRKSNSQEPVLPKFAGLAPSVEEVAETAVRDRDVEQLLHLIHQNGDEFAVLPSTSVPRKCNPVELACSLGYFEIVEIFLENGCSPNLPTAAGKLIHTVLLSLKSHGESIESGRRVVKNLISSGCDLNIKDRSGVTPLLHCAQIGDSCIMQAVLDQCSTQQLTFRCTGNYYTPLHVSAMRGDFECVKLLLSHSPHKHVNLKESHGNTALHLALKSMLHNIPYLNAAKAKLLFGAGEIGAQRASMCQELMKFQQNAVAIVEALVMAGTAVHSACSPPNYRGDIEEYYPLIYALQLCAEDHTQGFELDHNQFSDTLNLVSAKTIQSLEELNKAGPDEVSGEEKRLHKFSPYAGVVRLLVLAGTEVSANMREKLYSRFEVLHLLLDELCMFWDKYRVSKPPKLVHLTKLKIRSHLAELHQLHEINQLPLPSRLKEYIKLNYL